MSPGNEDGRPGSRTREVGAAFVIKRAEGTRAIGVDLQSGMVTAHAVLPTVEGGFVDIGITHFGIH